MRVAVLAFAAFILTPSAYSLETSQYLRSGWIQNDFPETFSEPPRKIFPENLSISSASACEKLVDDQGIQRDFPGWMIARRHCQFSKGYYETIRIYVSLSSESDDVDFLAHRDPWAEKFGRHVRVIRSANLLDLRRQIANLLIDCYVVEYAFVESHGSPNSIKVGSDLFRVADVLETGISPCFLSPNAKVQFTGCNTACAPFVYSLAKGVAAVFSGSGYRTENIQLMFNTDLGRSTTGILQFDFGRQLSVRSDNDSGLVLSVHKYGIESDIPLDHAPSCSDEALSTYFPTVRSFSRH